MTQQIKKLLVNVQQSFTEAEKAQGRSNLGCAATTDVPTDAVKYTPQSLSNIEKAQARQNINAATGDVATTASDGLMAATDKTKLDGIAAGAEVNVQSDWNQANTSADDYIKNKPSNATTSTDGFMSAADKTKLDGIEAGATKDKIAFVTTSDTYATVNEYITDGYEVILKYNSGGSDLFQYFRLSQYNPDGSMEFTCVRSGSGYVASYKYSLSTNSQWTRTDTSVSNYTGIQIDGIGRNLHLNQNNYVQTNFPGGLWTVSMAQDNNFRRLDNGGFNSTYWLSARFKTDDTYELGISYSGSGTSGTITFVGTETIVALDNSVTVKAAAYIGETVTYSVSSRFGGNESSAFDPSRHKAIYYSGFANIGPASDVKIAIWNDNGTVKIGMTSIEVGKVGATN